MTLEYGEYFGEWLEVVGEAFEGHGDGVVARVLEVGVRDAYFWDGVGLDVELAGEWCEYARDLLEDAVEEFGVEFGVVLWAKMVRAFWHFVDEPVTARQEAVLIPLGVSTVGLSKREASRLIGEARTLGLGDCVVAWCGLPAVALVEKLPYCAGCGLKRGLRQCSDCGVDVEEKVWAYSVRAARVPLCFGDQKKRNVLSSNVAR